MLLAHPAPDHAHAGQHHLHRMRDDVTPAAPLETVDSNRRHAARCTLVETDREIEILRRAPEPVMILLRAADRPLPRPGRAYPPDAALAIADRALRNDEPLLAVLLLDEPRRPVAELGIDVFVPEIQWLEDVSVGIDDVVSATHNP